MTEFPTACPSCRNPLVATRLKCGSCSTLVEGAFAIPALLRLPDADLEFVLRFVRASGSLKDVARQYGQSYPTIRNRLNHIMAALAETEGPRPGTRHEILDAVANGILSVAEAEQRLREAD